MTYSHNLYLQNIVINIKKVIIHQKERVDPVAGYHQINIKKMVVDLNVL
jgi:hypothetical protein